MHSGINEQYVRIRGWKLSLFSNPLYFTVFMCINVIFPLKEAQDVKLTWHAHSSEGFWDAAFHFPVDLKAVHFHQKTHQHHLKVVWFPCSDCGLTSTPIEFFPRS